MAEGITAAAANASLDNEILDTFVWIKLHVGAPGAACTANPATETDRTQFTFGSGDDGAATTTADGSWSAVAGTEDFTHFSAWDASTAGNAGFSGTITANAVTAGDTFTILTGDLDVAFTLAS